MNDSGPGLTCAACGGKIAGPYFTINGTIVCEACREPIERQLRGRLGPGRLGRALLSGLGGSVLGIGVYLGAPILFGVEVGVLVALIGYLIGKLVRKGGGGFGGRACRIIAMALTYASIGVAYLGIDSLTIGVDGQDDLPPPARPSDITAMIGLAIELPALRVVWAPSHALYIGFALWQAWRLNRPRRFVATGPYPPDDGGSQISREAGPGDVLNYPHSPSISGSDAPPGEDAPRP